MDKEKTPISFREAATKGVQDGLEFKRKNDSRKRLVCERIKYLRITHKITQSDLCEKIEVNRITYSGYENMRAEPTIEVLTRIADFFKVSLDYIAGRTDNPSGMTIEKKSKDIEKLKDAEKLNDIQKQLDELKKAILNE